MEEAHKNGRNRRILHMPIDWMNDWMNELPYNVQYELHLFPWTNKKEFYFVSNI